MAQPIAATPTLKGKYAIRFVQAMTGKRPAPTIKPVDYKATYQRFLERRKALSDEQK